MMIPHMIQKLFFLHLLADLFQKKLPSFLRIKGQLLPKKISIPILYIKIVYVNLLFYASVQAVS